MLISKVQRLIHSNYLFCVFSQLSATKKIAGQLWISLQNHPAEPLLSNFW